MWKKISKVWIIAALFVFAALPALAASPLTIGSRGDEVRSIQQILRSKGYRVNVNGVYTNDTARAVSQYQKDKKIQVSGKVGGWTYYLDRGHASTIALSPNTVISAAAMLSAISWSIQHTNTWVFPMYSAVILQMKVLTAQALRNMSFPIMASICRVWQMNNMQSASGSAAVNSCRATWSSLRRMNRVYPTRESMSATTISSVPPAVAASA